MLSLLSRIRPQRLKAVHLIRSGSPDSEKQFNRRVKNITTPAELFQHLFFFQGLSGATLMKNTPLPADLDDAEEFI